MRGRGHSGVRGLSSGRTADLSRLIAWPDGTTVATDRVTRPPQSAPGCERAAETDLQAFAVRLRRMNEETNRLIHGCTGAHGLHPTDVQARSPSSWPSAYCSTP